MLSQLKANWLQLGILLTSNLQTAPAAVPTFQIMEHSSARSVLSAGEELVLMIAAICHDLDHDGFTNSYHISSHSDLAQRYNDRSGEGLQQGTRRLATTCEAGQYDCWQVCRVQA
jgi:hypothetical protein